MNGGERHKKNAQALGPGSIKMASISLPLSLGPNSVPSTRDHGPWKGTCENKLKTEQCETVIKLSSYQVI